MCSVHFEILREIMAELQHQEAMDVDEESQCTPEDVFHALTTNNLACSLRVLGSQMGLKTSDLDPPSQGLFVLFHIIFQTIG